MTTPHLKHDSAGFLIGDPIDLGEAVSKLDAIRLEVRAIRQAVVGGQRQAQARAAAPSGQAVVPGRRTVGKPTSGSANRELATALSRQVAEMTRKAQTVAEPRGRGTAAPAAKNKESWFRRIWGELRGFRSEQSTYDKAANKSLKALEEKPVGGAGGGGGGLLPAILTAIGSALTSLIGALLSKIPLIGPRLGAAAGAAGGPLSLLKKAGKRLPLLGSLLAIGAGAWKSSEIENDPSLSRDQKNARHGRNWGGVGGGLAGAAAGAALGSFIPVVGTIVGGVVGAVVGEWLGADAGEIIGQNFAAITQSMEAGWNEVKATALGTWDWIKSGFGDVVTGFQTIHESISKKWEGFVDGAKAGWDSISGLFTSAFEGLKSLPVIGPAIQAAEDATKAAREAAAKVAAEAQKKAAELAAQAKSKAAEEAAKALASGKEIVANMVPQGLKDKIAARRVMESGQGYNVMQREDGSVERREGSRSWRNNNPGNIEAGEFANKHGAIGSDGRFAIFPSYEAGRAAKESLIFEGANYKSKTLSEAIARYAPPSENNTAAYRKAVLAAVGGQDKRMSDYTAEERAQIMDAMERQEGFRVGRVSPVGNGGGSSMASASGYQILAVSPAPAVFATPSIPSAPIIPSPPTVAEAPPVQIPLSSGAERPPVVLATIVREPGQDLSNRCLAHIVTGGYARKS